jgi:hypothetical protein
MKPEEELHLQESVNRGAMAVQIVNNPIYKEALISIRAQLFQQFEGTKFKESDLRDEAWRKLQAINYIEHYIEHVMRTGQMAERTLKDKVVSLGRRVLGR